MGVNRRNVGARAPGIAKEGDDMRAINFLYPEDFNFGMLESRALSELGARIARKVADDLVKKLDDRVQVPGLRAALRIIYEVDNDIDSWVQ